MFRAVVSRALLAVGAIVATLGLAELAARLAEPRWHPVGQAASWRYDPTLGWAHRAGAEGRFRSPHWNVGVRINEQGLRDVEHAYAKPPGARRLLLLGDSFGWGYGVEQDRGVAAVLAARCPDLEVINSSVSGYSTDQEYLYWRDEGRRYGPDIVLVLFHENDIPGDSLHRMYGYEKPQFRVERGELVLRNVPVPERRSWERAYNWLLARSWLANGILQRPAISLAFEYGLPFGTTELPSDFAVTSLLFAQLAREVRAVGGELRIAAVPMQKAPRAWLREAAREAGARVTDLEGPLQAAAARGVAIALPDDPHWNEEGHRIAGEAIARDLGCAPESSPAARSRD
jgi:lysophospholipase L1-like esterase